MENIVSLVNRRYTCKDFDPSKKISAIDLKKIKEILIKSPSSSNIQSTHFFIVESDEVKEKIADCSLDINRHRVRNASHVVIFCGMNGHNEAHFSEIYRQEKADGRFEGLGNEEEDYCKNRARMYMVPSFSEQVSCIDAQANIALGFFLLAIEGLGINATPMGGFIRGKVDRVLDLANKGLHSVYIVPIGYSAKTDFNATISKSRLPEQKLITVV